MADAVKVLRGLEELYPEMRLIERLRHCVEHFPRENWEDAMSRGQIRSKQWVIHELIRHGQTSLGSVVVCGGWLGTLSRMLLDNTTITTTHVDSMDLDVCATVAAGELNAEYITQREFTAHVKDCEHVDYTPYDTIINTSCEHFEQFYHWWDRVPTGKLVVLQSNDFREPEDHVNTYDSLEDFEDNLGEFSQMIYTGTMPTYKYNRFMVIGIK